MSVPDPATTKWVPLGNLPLGPAVVPKTRIVVPVGSSQAGFYTNLVWGDAVDTTLYFLFRVPDDYSSGDITFRVHVRGIATGVVAWRYSAFRSRLGAAFTPFLNDVSDNFTPGSANVVFRNVVIPAAQIQAGDALRVDLRRVGADGSDTMAASLAFDGAWIEYNAVSWVSGVPHPYTYGVTPPASPVEGDEWILPVGNGVLWRFRYNAGSASAYKWEFIGGAPFANYVETDVGTAATAAADLAASLGPAITIPRSGDYRFSYGCETYNVTGANNNFIVLTRVPGGAIAASITVQFCSVANSAFMLSREAYDVAGLTAADVMKMQYYTGAGTGNFRKRRMTVTPIRVS